MELKPKDLPSGFRQDRIERLLKELEFEVVRAMLEGEIDETLSFRFYVPRSKAIPDGIVSCEFRTRPVLCWQIHPDDMVTRPELKIVES